MARSNSGASAAYCWDEGRAQALSQGTFQAVLVVSTLGDALAAAAALGLLGRRGRSRGVPSLVAAAAMVALAFAIKLPLWDLLGLNVFGAMHLAFLDLALVAPSVALVILAMSRARWIVTPGARALAAMTLVAAVVGAAYVTRIEPFRLQVESARIDLPEGRSGRSPLRIGVLADLQASRVGAHERRAVAMLMRAAPDLILLPGDLWQGWPGQWDEAAPEIRDLLSELSAPGGVYLVLGDCDPPARTRRLIEGLDIRLLVNERAQVTVGDRRVTIGGVELDCASPAARAVIRALETTPGDGDVRLLLAHRPDALLAMNTEGIASRIDLLVAGHTHGGQVRAPGIGPPFTLSSVPRPVAAGGLHRVDGRRVYVSRGVGLERVQAPPIRFLCPPEVSLLTVGGPPEVAAVE